MTTHLFDSLQLLVIVEKEGQILVGDIDLTVSSLFTMRLLVFLATGKCMAIDLQSKTSRKQLYQQPTTIILQQI